MSNLIKYLGLIFVSAGLGYGIVSQAKIKSKIQAVVDPRKTSVIALEVGELIKNNRELLSEQKELQEQINKLTSATAQETEEGIEQELTRLKIIAGVTPVEGPGVEIKIEEFLQTVQLIDLINALRNIGAEAVSINDRRITGNTGIKEDNFSPPYVIKVIGEAQVLENALTRRGGIIEQVAAPAVVKLVNNLEIAAK